MINTILQQNSIGFLLADENKKIISLNKYITNLFNINNSEFIGADVTIMFKIDKNNLQKLNIIGFVSFDSYVNNYDKLINITVIKNDKFYYGIILDKTNENNLHNEIIKINNLFKNNISENERYKTLLNSIINALAHNFRTNIYTIKKLSNTDSIKYSDNIITLIDDILKYYNVFNHDVSISDVKLINLIHPNTLIETNIDDLIYIKSDTVLLNIIFNEIIDNAIKFGNNNIIKIIYTDLGFYHKISIKDNGIGFNIKYKNEIFKLFSKLNTTFTGTGLGLAIVKLCIDKLIGNINVNSQINIGSEFIILLDKQ